MESKWTSQKHFERQMDEYPRLAFEVAGATEQIKRMSSFSLLMSVHSASLITALWWTQTAHSAANGPS